MYMTKETKSNSKKNENHLLSLFASWLSDILEFCTFIISLHIKLIASQSQEDLLQFLRGK